MAIPQSGAAAPTWNREAPPTQPPGRAFAAMAFDQAHDEVVLFGGVNPSGLADTWTWDGARWTKEEPAVSPPARGYAAMAFDPASSRVILFGGYDPTGGVNRLFADTWAWDGTNWTLVTSLGPSARRNPTMAADRAGHLVLFGGATNVPLNETWIWDGATSQWSRATPSPSPPGQESSAGLAYDPVRRETVLVASKAAETWAWDGTTWARRGPARSPASRDAPALAYDARAESVVLFGGAGHSEDPCGFPGGFPQTDGCPLRDTWSWDGNDWSQQFPADAPGSTSNASMAQNPNRSPDGRALVYFGGLGASFADETWTWDAGVRPPPVVTGVAPNRGATGGGTAVTISGSRLSGVTQVHFGADPAATLTCPSATCTIANDSTITVLSPAHAPATVDVVVTSAIAGSSAVTEAARFTFIDPIGPPPIVTTIAPRSGSTTGGQVVTISGANLTNATAVRFGPDPAAAVACPGAACTIVNANQISVTTPAHGAGTVHVVVESPDGSSAATDADLFRYITPVTAPAVTGIDPLVGSTDGGERVIVRGTGLAPVTKVRFGPGDNSALNCPGSACTVTNDFEIAVITPSHAPESVHVTVITPDRSSVATDADVFTFVLPAAVGGLSVGGQPALVQPASQSSFQASPPGGSSAATPSLTAGSAPASALSASPLIAPGGNAALVPGGSGGASTAAPGAPPPPPAAAPGTQSGAGYAPSGLGTPGEDPGADAATNYTMVRKGGDVSPVSPVAVVAGGSAVGAIACAGIVLARRRTPRPQRAYGRAY